MIVVTVSKCPPSLRGDLSKWLFEISTGVYVGNVSTRVREKLWERINLTVKTGRAIMVYSSHNEQKLSFLTIGSEYDRPVDYDGLVLMKHFKNKVDKKPVEVKFDERIKENLFPENNFVALDIETTGLDPQKDEITEIAAVRFEDGLVTDQLKIYVKIDRPIPDKIKKITGITDELLNIKGINLTDALNEVIKFIGIEPIVCHNADFDMGFLKEKSCINNLHFPNNQVFDTCKLSRKLIKNVKNFKLQTLAEFYQIPMASNHEALTDARTAGELLIKLKSIG